MKTLLITLALLTAVTGASAQQLVRYHYKVDAAHQTVIQRENDSLIVRADRYQLRADITYRDELLANSGQMRQLPLSEVRYLTDTAVRESRNLLYLEETWFRENYGVPCGSADEAFKP